jgi:serine/threonine-protein phosphatase 2A regulatory subunit A
MKVLTDIFGVQWSVKHMLPKLLSLHVEQNYLHRLTPLFGMAIISPALNADVIKKMFLPVLITLSSDKIANIRMNCAKTIQAMHSVIKGSDVEVI